MSFTSRVSHSVSPYQNTQSFKTKPSMHLLESRETDMAPATPDSVEHIQPKIHVNRSNAPNKVELESSIHTFTRSSIWWLLAAGASFVAGNLSRDTNLPATIFGLGLGGFGLWQGLRKGRQVEAENETFVQKALDQQQASLDAHRMS